MGTFGSRPRVTARVMRAGAFLLKQLDQPLLPRHQRVDLRRLAVEEGGDGFLAPSSGGTE